MCASAPIHADRIQQLNAHGIQTRQYVLYWMQQSQRAEDNHALEYAIYEANCLKQPLVVAFGLTDAYPEANLRHYTFLLEGLRETAAALAARGIKFVLRRGHPPEIAVQLGKSASLIICDRGYLRHQRAWRKKVAQQADCRVVQVESDVIVPLEIASSKAEYAARTLRPKIMKQVERYLKPIPRLTPDYSSLGLDLHGDDFADMTAFLSSLNINRRIPPVSRFFRGGTSEAKRRFREFIEQRLPYYDDHSNQPQTDDISQMSSYLHFGQISPVYLAQQIQASPYSIEQSGDAFLEQLIVRRELAMNFVFYTPDYDAFSCLPNWAQTTLRQHKADQREYLYSRDELENANTHDPYWNAAMQEMKQTGFMHNYMRMYWGKKILEWTRSPEEAFATTLTLNNRYFLDGRDPNSYASVAWLYGAHDRAWNERPIFGKVRCMTASGLERKCDMPAYREKVCQLSVSAASS